MKAVAFVIMDVNIHFGAKLVRIIVGLDAMALFVTGPQDYA